MINEENRNRELMEKEAWRRTRDLYWNLINKGRVPHNRFTLGEFECDGSKYPGRLVYKFGNTKVHMFLGYDRLASRLGSADDFFDLQEGNTLHRLQIGSIVERTEGGEYPRFFYTWYGGIHDRGKLSDMTILFADGSLVGYSSLDKAKLWKNGNPKTLATVPDSWNGVEEILERKIPYKIDFDSRGDDILRRMRFEELIKAFG